MILRLLALTFLLGSLSFPARAELLNFFFTTTAGGSTISGEIIGLKDNQDSAPSDILIFCDPLNNAISATSPSQENPYSLAENGYSGVIGFRKFSVWDCEITAANVVWEKDVAFLRYDRFAFDGSLLGFFGRNGEQSTIKGNVFSNYNYDGFCGTTYTLAVPVPEPSQWGMMLSLVVVAGLVYRRIFVRA